MKLEVGQLSRIEGHGGILVELEGNKIKKVNFNVFEGQRLIEALTIGKTPEEDLNIVCRICAICTLSHRYSALRALEKALGIQVPTKVHLMRTLMHMGEMIESHALHVFFLSLPDLVGRSSAIDLLDKYRDEVGNALRLKKFGNRIMQLTSARMIHGENPVIGGFGRYLTIKELTDLKEEAEELTPCAVKSFELLGTFSYPSFFEQDTLFMALNPEGNKYGFVGDAVLLSSGEGRSIEEYKELTNERVESHSCAKRSRYKGKSFTVGAIARVNLLGDRLTGEAGRCFRQNHNPRWRKNPLYNVNAQALELVYSLEEIPRLVDQILSLEDPRIVKPSRSDGEATGAVEAPRGTLYHHYMIRNGLIAGSDIITPTAQFLDDIEKYFKIATEKAPSDSDFDLGFTLEMIARAYDPCISCSTHLVKVQSQEATDWRISLGQLFAGQKNPLFIGFGNCDRADDGLGTIAAMKLKESGYRHALTEAEWLQFADTNLRAENPIVFIDAVDFSAVPGDVALFPLVSADAKEISTHRAHLSFFSELARASRNGSYILGIQPRSTAFSRDVSAEVARAVDEVVRFVDEVSRGKGE